MISGLVFNNINVSVVTLAQITSLDALNISVLGELSLLLK